MKKETVLLFFFSNKLLEKLSRNKIIDNFIMSALSKFRFLWRNCILYEIAIKCVKIILKYDFYSSAYNIIYLAYIRFIRHV